MFLYLVFPEYKEKTNKHGTREKQLILPTVSNYFCLMSKIHNMPS